MCINAPNAYPIKYEVAATKTALAAQLSSKGLLPGSIGIFKANFGVRGTEWVVNVIPVVE
jgi:hypothetical protein